MKPAEGQKLSQADRMKKMEKAKADFNAGLKNVLTPDQYKKYDKQQADMKKMMEEKKNNAQRPARPAADDAAANAGEDF